MIKRTSWKRYGCVVFALILLIMSWESNKSSAAVLAAEIPQQSIRVRIIANSDTIQDQALKRVVRDRLVDEMSGWVTEPRDIAAARQTLLQRLPEIDGIVGAMLRERGFGYGHRVELATVPFPEKMYGSRLYPAGRYESLRITLGRGEGQNWWCVLFPPLCFADAVTKNAKEQTGPQINENLGSADVEVRFFVWDAVKHCASAIQDWLS